jgi:DNA-binding transcriptional MocR family regulator
MLQTHVHISYVRTFKSVARDIHASSTTAISLDLAGRKLFSLSLEELCKPKLRAMTSLLPKNDEINPQLGWPSPALFPAKALNTASDNVLTSVETASQALIYGANCGYAPLRKHVAEWLASSYHSSKSAINESRICICAGASQTLANVLLRFTDPSYTRNVWMVEPTYFLAYPIFEDCGFVGRLRGVPEDDEGIDIGFLRDSLAEVDKSREATNGLDVPRTKTPEAGYKKIFKHIYCVPTFSNPSGKTMSLRRRTS